MNLTPTTKNLEVLDSKEKREDGNITIGRLRTAIRQGAISRALALLEKISDEYMDLRILKTHKKEIDTRSFHTIAREGGEIPDIWS